MSNDRHIRLFEAFDPSCCIAGSTASAKEEALREIAAAAAGSSHINSGLEENIFQALCEREKIGSTGFGNGIAIPHCRLEAVEKFVVGVVTFPAGLEFESLDDKPVRIAVFIIGPRADNGNHVRLLSAISQALMIPGAVKEISEAKTIETIEECFLRHVKDDDTPKDSRGKNLFHIFVREEEKFREILQVFTALDAHSLVVVESQPPSAYLGRVALFADFWSDDTSNFCRIIIAVMNKKLCNEAIRRIEQITGPLDDSREVLVTMQEVAFTAGALDL